MFSETAGAGYRQSKSKKGPRILPITFWTDLEYKEIPSVKMTEESIGTEHNRPIKLEFGRITTA